MGFKNLLAKTFGSSFVEALDEREPALFIFIDALNEMTIFEAWALYLDKKKQLYLEANKNPSFRMPDEKMPIDWTQYFIRLTREPFTEVVKDFLKKEFGITEIADIQINEFLDAVTKVGDDKE